MLAISAVQPIRWQADWDVKTQDGAVFYYRAATVTERELFEAEAAGYRAARVFPWDLTNQFFAGLQALLPEDPESIDRVCDVHRRNIYGEEISAAEQAELDQVSDALVQHWPGYRLLIEQSARRDAVMPILAVRRFVCGWENVVDGNGDPVPFTRGLDGMVPELSLKSVTPLTLKSLGMEIYSNLYATGEAKNSAPPSKSGGGQRISKPRNSVRKAGRSVTTSGPKTQR
jgi:hypothetical protein